MVESVDEFFSPPCQRVDRTRGPSFRLNFDCRVLERSLDRDVGELRQRDQSWRGSALGGCCDTQISQAVEIGQDLVAETGLEGKALGQAIAAERLLRIEAFRNGKK